MCRASFETDLEANFLGAGGYLLGWNKIGEAQINIYRIVQRKQTSGRTRNRRRQSFNFLINQF